MGTVRMQGYRADVEIRKGEMALGGEGTATELDAGDEVEEMKKPTHEE